MAKPKLDANCACVYCDRPTKRTRRGEHIIPDCIGGRRYISEMSGRLVCEKCNNGVLSELDRELCNRSHLSVVASQEIDQKLWHAWDVDHAAGNLLVEARPSWVDGELDGLACYPQLTFESRGPELRGDAEEMECFGREDFTKVTVRAARIAFQKYCSGVKNALVFEPVDRDILSQGYRFSPRIYVNKPIGVVARKINDQSLILRYTSPTDRDRALLWMSRLDGGGRWFNRWAVKMGSHTPAIATFSDLGKVVRALMKIGVNLLAAYCESTHIGRSSFAEVIRIVLGEAAIRPGHLGANGFVEPRHVTDFAWPGCHSFRLEFARGVWVVYSSFFGGRVASKVVFQGPNSETWKALTVHAPIGSRDWREERSGLHIPRAAQVIWNDPAKITPSLKMQHRTGKIVSSYEQRRRA